MPKDYNSFSDVATGDVYSAASHNLILENLNNYRVPPSCEVYLSADETSYSALAAIPWDASTHDTDSMWSAGDPTKITIQTTGLYIVKFYCYLTCAATLASMNIEWSLNGSYDAGIGSFAGRSGTLSFGLISDVFALTAGDYITASANPSGGSAYVINGNASPSFDRSRFSATWIGQVS